VSEDTGLTGRLVSAQEYSTDDLANTVRVLGPWWYCLTEHLETPSVDPVLSDLLEQQRNTLAELAASTRVPQDLFRLDLSGEHELSLAVAMIRKRTDEDVRHALEVCVDASMLLIHQAARVVRRLRPPSTTQGTVSGLFVSSGGVPKKAVTDAIVGPRGLSGDRQQTRKHHGRPWQALCLWSAEVVAQLRAEGHPIEPGSSGENISISGLDWTEVLPGSQVTIGSMVCEVSLYTLPCSKNAQWFVIGTSNGYIIGNVLEYLACMPAC
jgi:hypothetical protein